MLISQRPTLSEEVIAEDRSQFIIEPLEPGFGYTLWQFAAPHVAVIDPRCRRDEHPHRWSAARIHHGAWGQEDVTDIILNLKSLVVSSEEDEPVTMYLRKRPARSLQVTSFRPPGCRCTTRRCTSPP